MKNESETKLTFCNIKNPKRAVETTSTNISMVKIRMIQNSLSSKLLFDLKKMRNSR
jgi:hypothetical protein